jgi:NAD+ synthetase
MKEITDYGKVFEALVTKTADYLVNNNIKAQILGISGGIDSTVCAAICHEVAKRTRIPLIGRSLPTKYNKENEVTTAQLVGNAFCDDFEEVPIKNPYESFLSLLDRAECGMTAIANGNIQARLRMIYLYNLASIYRGLVIDTDNLTENNLGYFTIHGDVGDFNPIGGLWKTEVFELAKYLTSYYTNISNVHSNTELILENLNKSKAIAESIKLIPTAGLGITNNDLEEIGAESYEQVDKVLQCFTDSSISIDTIDDIPDPVLESIVKRYNASKFKRKRLPIKIDRIWLQ